MVELGGQNQIPAAGDVVGGRQSHVETHSRRSSIRHAGRSAWAHDSCRDPRQQTRIQDLIQAHDFARRRDLRNKTISPGRGRISHTVNPSCHDPPPTTD